MSALSKEQWEEAEKLLTKVNDLMNRTAPRDTSPRERFADERDFVRREPGNFYAYLQDALALARKMQEKVVESEPVDAAVDKVIDILNGHNLHCTSRQRVRELVRARLGM